MIARPAFLVDLPWIEEKTGCVLTRKAKGIKVLDVDGKIRGMVAYDMWTENACQCHMAAESPIVWRRMLGPAFSYPFSQLGLGKIIGIIPGNNTSSLGMTKKLGFNASHRVKDGWSIGVDLVVFEMEKQNCRWI